MAESTTLVCVNDYEQKAVALLDGFALDYYQSGADDEQTLRDNVTDFKRFRLRPRMMVDVSTINMKTTILGSSISFPVCIAPTAYHKLAHPLGEIASAQAANTMGTCMVLSMCSNTSVKEVSERVPDGLRWFQLQILKDRPLTCGLVRIAETYGCQALVLTVDQPDPGAHKVMNVWTGSKIPPPLRFGHFEDINEIASLIGEERMEDKQFFPVVDQSVTWSDLTWLKSITSLPVVVKGILTGFDAEEAIKAGADAILVSNHGARQLDGVSSTIMALSEIVKQVGNRVEIYMDGGVRTGTDVLKALALGARAVFIGRPVLYGLAVSGEQGVTDVLTILQKELKLAMQLSGQVDVKDLSEDLVLHESVLYKQ